jgi:hypothetical protein
MSNSSPSSTAAAADLEQYGSMKEALIDLRKRQR